MLFTAFDMLHSWLDADHGSPDGLGDRQTHFAFGRRLTLRTGVSRPPSYGTIS